MHSITENNEDSYSERGAMRCAGAGGALAWISMGGPRGRAAGQLEGQRPDHSCVCVRAA